MFPSPADARPVRVATFNVEFGTGPVGSDKYNAIHSTLARIDADVVCFQELWPDTFGAWSNMASSLGYSNTAIGANAPFSGGMYLGYASRFPILSTANATSPPGAVELTRNPFRAVIAVPDAQRPLVLWTMHHKSSDANIDKFRRSVEAYRAVQNIDAYLAANPDHNEYLFVGDMNEDIRDSQTAQYASQPSGAPDNYVLGSDISFPVLYSKFPTDRYAAAGLGLVRMTSYWENSSTPITRIESGRQLDYVFLSPALMDTPLGAPVAETYYSANDLGGGLPKAGARLPAGTSAAASDHLPIFFDIEMADYSTVIPSAAFAAAGEAGGPFSPASKTYVIRETNSFSTSWSISADVAWLSISPTNPVAAPQEPRNVVVSFNTAANALAPGTYEGSVTFRNLTTGLVEIRHVVLAVRDHLAVSPEEGFASAGLMGGPFTPASKVYVVTNKSAVSRAFTARASTNWLTVSPASGTIPARQAVAVTVSINANANPLLGKTYSASVVFSNQASGLVHGRPVTLAISGALCDAVDDCGQVWTTGGNSVWYYQTTNTSDGIDAARSGPVTNRQTNWLQTTVVGPGQVAFNWKVSSRYPYHPLTFYDNGNRRAFISGAVDWTRYTYELTSGVHTLRWTMDLSSLMAAYSNSAGWLDQVAIDHFAITPTNVWTASGILDGPFSPPSKTYFLTNGGTATLQWSAASSVPWITAEPPYGTLAPGSTSTVTLVLNEAANALPLGSNGATIVFANQNSGIEVSRRVVVNVSGDLCHAVERCDLPWTTGGNANWFFQTVDSADGIDAAQSGGLGNNQQTWLETVVTGPVQLGFKWKVESFLSSSANILSVADNGAVRAQIVGDVGWTPMSIEIPAGIHTARWAFATSSNTMYSPNAGWIDQITLDPFGIFPANGWDISGYLAGPYSSTNCSYVITNAGTASFAWSAATGVNWISAEPASGEIAPGSSTTVVFSLNADLLPRGTYATTLVFTNHTSGGVVSRPVSMTLVSALCDAVDWCSLDWTTGGEAPWFRQTAIAQDGIDAAQSGAIAANRQTWMQTVVNGPLRLAFKWRVSSATNADFLTLLDNGEPLDAISGEVPWTSRAYDIATGIHTLRWAFVTSTNASGGANAAWLDTVALDYFVVLGSNSWKSTGMPGGPFIPVTGNFGINNSGPVPIGWGITTNVPWMFVTPSRGVIAPSSSVGIVISINTNANKLAPGLYTGRAQFYHDGASFSIVRSTELEVLDYLLVSPTSHVAYTSFVGGASAPLARTYSLSNTGPSSLDWSVTQDAAWISVEPVSGTLAPGATGAVVFTLATNALPETMDQYPALATFSNHASGLTIARPFTLVVTNLLSISGSGVFVGPAGGPFSPSSALYTLFYRGPAECSLTATSSVPWLSSVIPNSALTPNTSRQAYAVLEPSAAELPAGIHFADLLFTESASGTVLTQRVSLAIGVPFCEAADACDLTWTFGGITSWLYQATTTHDGVDAAASGDIGGNRNTSMQTSVAGPGTLSFWWKVSSEPNNDVLEFLLDGVRNAAISGETDWHRQAYTLGAGTHTLGWRYSKSSFTIVGADRGWVDEIVWTPAPTTAMGVPIEWYQHFGLAPEAGGSWNDLDTLPAASGDPNWIQYFAGLDPNDSDARFRILGIDRTVGQPTLIHWRGGTNGPATPYVVQSTTNLEIGPWSSTGSSPRVEGLNIWTNPEPADVRRYYRILAPH